MTFEQEITSAMCGLLLLFSLPLMLLLIGWFLFQICLRRSRKKRIGLGTWILGIFTLISVVASGTLFLGWRKGRPPHHRATRQVNVAYFGPKLKSDGREACFVKTVTQEETGLNRNPIGGPLPLRIDWDVVAFRFWSKTFLCRSESDGSSPTVLYEIASDQLPSRSCDYRPGQFDSWHRVLGFDVSWVKQMAVVMLEVDMHDPNIAGTNNLQVIDLHTGTSRRYTFPTRMYDDHFSMQLIDGQTKVLLGSYSEYLGILNLGDSLKSTNIFSKSGDWFFKPPAWSDEQKMFAIEVHSQIWIFTSDLELIEKVSETDLAPVLRAKQQNKQPPEHKYAWVVDKLWAGYLPEESKRTGANATEFQLKTHTIPSKHIDPKDAASIW